MSKESVLYRRNGNIGMITLNRPERLNAINGISSEILSSS